jgi:hypothetical protein
MVAGTDQPELTFHTLLGLANDWGPTTLLIQPDQPSLRVLIDVPKGAEAMLQNGSASAHRCAPASLTDGNAETVTVGIGSVAMSRGRLDMLLKSAPVDRHRATRPQVRLHARPRLKRRRERRLTTELARHRGRV